MPPNIPIGDGKQGDEPEPRPPARRQPPREPPKPAVIPTGFFEITARDDKRRILIRWTDVMGVLEPLNVKDGTKVLVRGLGHFEADEPYNTVLARMAEVYSKAQEEGRGW